LLTLLFRCRLIATYAPIISTPPSAVKQLSIWEAWSAYLVKHNMTSKLSPSALIKLAPIVFGESTKPTVGLERESGDYVQALTGIQPRRKPQWWFSGETAAVDVVRWSVSFSHLVPKA